MINQIHQIELSSRCNLSCRYCPQGAIGLDGSPVMKRERRIMSNEAFDRALEWLKYFVKQGTQEEVNLAGIGESLLNSSFGEMVTKVREVIGPERRIVLASNGTIKSAFEAHLQAMKDADVRVSITAHEPVLCAETVELLRKNGLLDGITLDPVVAPNDWAGQVKWIRPKYRMLCPWIRGGWGFVTATGQILTCCLDITGESMLSTILAAPREIETTPWSLCRSCYQDP